MMIEIRTNAKKTRTHIPGQRTWDQQIKHSVSGGRKGKSYGLGPGWISPRRTSRCRWRRFPLWRRGAASPLRATRLPLSPHCNPFSASTAEQPRCFPPQSVRFFSLFCRTGFKERSGCPFRPERQPPLIPYSPGPRQGRLRLHTALRPRRTDAPHCRFTICFVHRPKIPRWEYVCAQQQVSTKTGSG